MKCQTVNIIRSLSRIVTSPHNEILRSSPLLAPLANRRVIEPAFKLREADETVSVELAQVTDYDIVRKFVAKDFARRESLLHFCGTDPELILNACLDNVIRHALSYPYSTMAFHDGYLVGLNLVTMQWIDQTRCHPQPKLPTDFGPAIHRLGLVNHGLDVATILAIYGYFDAIVPNFLPKFPKRYFAARGQLSAVRVGYEGQGIHTKLVVSSAKQLENAAHDVYFTVNTAAVGDQVNRALGMAEEYAMPYSQALIHGRQLFPGGVMVDGSKKINVFVGDTAAIASFYQKSPREAQE